MSFFKNDIVKVVKVVNTCNSEHNRLKSNLIGFSYRIQSVKVKNHVYLLESLADDSSPKPASRPFHADELELVCSADEEYAVSSKNGIEQTKLPQVGDFIQPVGSQEHWEVEKVTYTVWCKNVETGAKTAVCYHGGYTVVPKKLCLTKKLEKLHEKSKKAMDEAKRLFDEREKMLAEALAAMAAAEHIAKTIVDLDNKE